MKSQEKDYKSLELLSDYIYGNSYGKIKFRYKIDNTEHIDFWDSSVDKAYLMDTLLKKGATNISYSME